MKIFLDTSTLFKLYHLESGTKQLILFFKSTMIESVFLSEITKLEFDSVVWKKVRKREIDDKKAQGLIKNFENDWGKFSFINDDAQLKHKARQLISKYGNDGLRTLDSIKLASAIHIKKEADLFFTDDYLLLKLFKKEKLHTEILKQ